MLPIPPINAHPNTEVKDSCNCCNPIKVIMSHSRTKVKISDDELAQVEKKIKEVTTSIRKEKNAVS